jgi:hypothetical protein
MITQPYPHTGHARPRATADFLKVSTVTSGAGKQANPISRNPFVSLNASLFTMQQRSAPGWKRRNTTNPWSKTMKLKILA